MSSEPNQIENINSSNSKACDCWQEIVHLKNEISLLKEQVRTDGLTGLYNFRFFNEALVLEIERAIRTAHPLSMILLDIDHFKKFNDRWGHDIGNKALVHVANLVKIALRKLDLPCRFGGEEFSILLPNTDLRQAVQVAERLREAIASTSIKLENTEDVFVTASLGVDQFAPHSGETSEAFLRRVDHLLYQAKHNGRNRLEHGAIAPSIKIDSVTQDERDILFGTSDSSDQ